MNAEQKRLAREILADAVEKPDPGERVVFIAQACGTDSELRQLVDALVQAHEQAGDFLQQTIAVGEDNLIGEGPGTVIGRYKLLQEIGEGGFGLVFMAEQLEPFQRKVALKIIKAGMDTREVIARLEAERQALALMDHPNIARVLDAGATESGRPYFVMELVKGIPITAYCDQHNLSTAERLNLFIKVCHAVQHAHQKGIIHRDLKRKTVWNGLPSNLHPPSSILAGGAFAALLLLAGTGPMSLAGGPAATKSESIPIGQLGAVAGKQYQGDGLSVSATPEGARLRCPFQRLEGQATPEGLWFNSTAEGTPGECFRLVAVAVGRGSENRRSGGSAERRQTSGGETGALCRDVATAPPVRQALPRTGTISMEDKGVRFTRPGLTGEYSVSMDGVRQDFVIKQRPGGEGPLRVDLEVSGAKAEPLADGARLVLDGSGRKLAYSRLRAVDAAGQELAARLEVLAATRLAVVVDDTAAAYPVRIDPTFSDADWVSLNLGMPGANGDVYAIVADGSGNVYVGGSFTFIGTVPANRVAKWNGIAWSALGSGVTDNVYALAAIGTDLYAGGSFTTAGGVPAMKVAKWDGNAWSALGPGMSGPVFALAVSGTDLYAGGNFTTAGGVTANYIAKWNGSVWSPLGSGMNDRVCALAMSGTNLYAGGGFITAGGVAVNQIAKWNGSAWSALGSGMNDSVAALAADGAGRLFVGGGFGSSLAGTNVSPFIAQANVGVGVAGGQFGNFAFSPATGLSCAFRDATPGQPYRIQTSPSLGAGSWTDFTNFTYTNPLLLNDTSAVAAPKRFYRAITP